MFTKIAISICLFAFNLLNNDLFASLENQTTWKQPNNYIRSFQDVGDEYYKLTNHNLSKKGCYTPAEVEAAYFTVLTDYPEHKRMDNFSEEFQKEVKNFIFIAFRGNKNRAIFQSKGRFKFDDDQARVFTNTLLTLSKLRDEKPFNEIFCTHDISLLGVSQDDETLGELS